MATSSQVTALTNYDAGTIGQDAIAGRAKLAVVPFTYEKIAGNTDGDKILLQRLHKNWCVLDILIQNDALTGCTDVNVGLYTDDPVASATVKSENCYSDAITLATALGLTSVGYEARDKAVIGQKVWQDAGASSIDAAEEWYRLGLTLITGGTATGTISGYVLVALPS